MVKQDEDKVARIQYLQRASEALLATSPAISSHIQRVRHTFTDDKGIPEVKDRGLLSCEGCGQLLVSGVTCDPRKQRSIRRRKPAKVARIDSISLECRVCHLLTSIKKPDKQAKRPVLPTSDSRLSAPKQEDILHRVGSTSDSNARTNRKSRSNKKSLLALINKTPTTPRSSAGFGFSLGDFLTK